MIRCENQLPALWELDFNHSKSHSVKQSPLVSDKTAKEDSDNQHQYVDLHFLCSNFDQKFQKISWLPPIFRAMSSAGEIVGEESIRDNKSNGYADDNKENSTINIADKLLYDSFTDDSLLSADDSLLRITKRKLPLRSKTKQTLKKLCDRSVKNAEKECSAVATTEVGEPSELFRGFSPEFYPRKMILLGFLIHDMQSKLTANQTV